jgi:predicted MFS family arabinose efflux permease
VPIGMMALVGLFTWEFQTVLPAMASQTLHGRATDYGLILAAQGVGSVLGGLSVAATRRIGPRLYVLQAIAFGVTMTLASAAPNLVAEMGLMSLVGFTATSFMATGNTVVQLNTERSMRGRIMSLWVVASQGMTPVGGPLAGFVTHTAGARAAMAMGAAACFGAAGLGTLMRGRQRDMAVPANIRAEVVCSSTADTTFTVIPATAKEEPS